MHATGNERKDSQIDRIRCVYNDLLDESEGHLIYMSAMSSNGDLGGAGDEKCTMRL